MIKTIIVDDEKNSCEVLEWQLKTYCPSIEIIASCNDPIEAVALIKKYKPQLLFLDIEMPNMNGFELLNKLNPITFEVIFTTAYNEFAVKAFKVNAIDYLLKPIDVTELKEAVNKLEKKIAEKAGHEKETPQQPRLPKRIALTTGDTLVFVDSDEIIYCEGNSNYTFFHLANATKKTLVSKTLKEIEETLSSNDFFRIHNSYIINMKHVKEFVRGAGGHVVMSNGDHITVSRNRKDDFFNLFSKF